MVVLTPGTIVILSEVPRFYVPRFSRARDAVEGSLFHRLGIFTDAGSCTMSLFD